MSCAGKLPHDAGCAGRAFGLPQSLAGLLYGNGVEMAGPEGLLRSLHCHTLRAVPYAVIAVVASREHTALT